uniref:Synembryn-A n=1 Tax=Phallusia mammillata TaxID=59560 RepID=A0A6F9DR38_9ASCI|nr:synembryn-A [Phallusia mammillata]
MDLEEPALRAIQSGDETEISQALQEYNETLQSNPQLQQAQRISKQELAKEIIQLFCASKLLPYAVEAVTTLRFLSRDKSVVAKHFTEKRGNELLLNLAKLNANEDYKYSEPDVELNACKCLCNVIYLSKDATGLCKNSSFIKALVHKIGSHKKHTHNQNVINLKLIFLVSALNPEGRKIITEQCDGRKSVLDFLNNTLESSTNNEDTDHGKKFTADKTTICCELLKVLFNLNMDLRHAKIYSENETEELNLTMEYCRTILLSTSSIPELTEGLHCSAGNAIYSIPPVCMSIDRLLLVSKDDTAPSDIKQEIMPVMVLVDILKEKVMNDIIKTEILHPILALLSDLCRRSSEIRRYFKDLILPPRKDFKHRPEEGLRFRNKLIKLFTHTNTNVKEGVADFLFVLCKESVDRFVKYTGYGNAAGLLASRGLLAGGHGETVYSDADSDSDTEEYKEASTKINPVTGHIPLPVSSPMEGMTDEQKEHLAAQLANDISKLSSGSIIQPMGIGPDGSLVPLQQQVHDTELKEDSDSD